jgi:hypothetical protein
VLFDIAQAAASLVTVFISTRQRLGRVEGAVLLVLFAAYTGWLLVG